jgi:hypothetical protein
MRLDSSTIGSLCAAVDFAENKPQLDLSAITFVTPFAVIYLGLFLRYHNSRGIAFAWTEPKERKVRQYLATIRFYERFNFDPQFVWLQDGHRRDRETSLNDILDIQKAPEAGDDVARKVADVIDQAGVPVDIGLVAEMVSELVDNFTQHSGTEHPATLTMQWFPQKERLALALGDCGLGIRRTLQRNEQFADVAHMSDEEAIALALEQRVSCQPGHGMGLTETKEKVVEMHGRMIIASGSGCVIIIRDKQSLGQMGYDLPGVQLGIEVPTPRG